MSSLWKSSSFARITALAVVCGLAVLAQSALAADGTWITDTTDGSYPPWTTTADWVGGIIPGTATEVSGSPNTDIAIFGTTIATGVANASGYSGFATYYLGGMQLTGNISWSGAGGIVSGNMPISFGTRYILPDNPATSTGKSFVIDSNYASAPGTVFDPAYYGMYLHNTAAAATGLASNFSFISNTNIPFDLYDRGNGVKPDATGVTNLILGGTGTGGEWGMNITEGDLQSTPIPGATLEITKQGTGTWMLDTLGTGSNKVIYLTGPINVMQGTLNLQGNNNYVHQVMLSGNNVSGLNTVENVINVASGAYLGTTNAGGAQGATGDVTGGLCLFCRSTSNTTMPGITLQGNGTVNGGVTGFFMRDGGNAGNATNREIIKPGDPINTNSAVGTLNITGNLVLDNLSGSSTSTIAIGINSVTGSGPQSAATSGNGWTGGSQLNIGGYLDLTHVNASLNGANTQISITGYNAPGPLGTTVGTPAGWTGYGTYSWQIVTTGSGFTGVAFSTSLFSIATTGLTTTGTGFSIKQNGNNIELDYNGLPLVTTTSTTYNLTAAVTGSANILKGASTAISANITNTGVGTADTLNYAGLNVNGTAVSPSSGGPLANNLGNATGTGTFTGIAFGDAILTPGVSSATNATIGGSATLGTTTTATVNVGVGKSLSTSFGTPLTGGVAASGSYAGLASMAGGDSNSVFTIARGTNTSVSPVTVSNAWRTAISGPETAIGTGLVSDVVQTAGLNAGDTIVVEMSYDATKLAALHNGATPNANGSVYLAELISGNWTAAGSSWDGNQDLTNGGVLAGLTAGEFGVDLGQGVVWAAITGSNVNGTFAAVPEPGTIAMLISGLLALAGFAYRRKK